MTRLEQALLGLVVKEVGGKPSHTTNGWPLKAKVDAKY